MIKKENENSIRDDAYTSVPFLYDAIIQTLNCAKRLNNASKHFIQGFQKTEGGINTAN